jgi:hypothetical protein
MCFILPFKQPVGILSSNETLSCFSDSHLQAERKTTSHETHANMTRQVFLNEIKTA